MHHEKRPAKPRAATSCPGSTQSWATRAQRYSSTRASKPRYIQAPRRHRKGKPPTHLARPTAPAGSARPRAGPTLPQLRDRARPTKHPPGRSAEQQRSATVRGPQELHGAPLKRPPPPPPPPPDTTHIDRRDTQRHSHRAALDTTATRPPYTKTQKKHSQTNKKR